MKNIREDIPYLKKATLLNFAATAPIPHFVSNRMQEVCRTMEEPLGHHFYKSLGVLEKGRQKLADLLGASASEVAFTQNTSSSLSAIAQSILWKTGDIILVPRDEFPSNKFVWEFLENKYETKVIYIDPIANEPIIETIKKLDIDIRKVKLLSISPVSYRTGRVYELNDIISFCKENQIFSCFDAIQAVGVIPFNVKDLDVDIVVGGAQKWLLGPIGCGYIYLKKELLPQFQTPLVGWCSLEFPEKFEFDKQKLADELTQFEPGLPNLFSIAGFSAAIDSFFEFGLDKIYKKIQKNTQYLDQVIESLGLINLRGKNDLAAGIVSFLIPEKFDMRDWQEEFSKEKISLTIRDQYIRVSPHYFTTDHELAVFVKTLKSLLNSNTEETDSFNVLAKPLTAIKGEEGKIFLVTGASGILGREIVRQLLLLEHIVHAQGRNKDALKDVEGIQNGNMFFYDIDVENQDSLQTWLATLKEKNIKFDGLINCLGHLEIDEIKHLDGKQLAKSFKVNVFSPYAVMRFFISSLSKENGIGLINIIASSGRCGYPILSHYAATQGALWTLTESLNRELIDTKLSAKIYIASPMHSKLQKKIGRIALRFFKTNGAFDYDHADIISKDIISFFMDNKKSLKISFKNRIQLFFNIFYPSYIDKKMAKIWK